MLFIMGIFPIKRLSELLPEAVGPSALTEVQVHCCDSCSLWLLGKQAGENSAGFQVLEDD